MGSPMYRQIAETLREQIQSGDLQPGEQLKTELELREAFGASRNTVRDAIKGSRAIEVLARCGKPESALNWDNRSV